MAPFPWRKLLQILMKVATSDPERSRLFTPQDVHQRILYLCHGELFSARRQMCRILKTPIPKHSRYGTSFGATEPGVAFSKNLQPFPVYENKGRRWGSDIDVSFRQSNGPRRAAHMDALHRKNPWLKP